MNTRAGLLNNVHVHESVSRTMRYEKSTKDKKSDFDSPCRICGWVSSVGVLMLLPVGIGNSVMVRECPTMAVCKVA